MGNNKATFCPLIKKDCIEHKCHWYMFIAGTNPNTGEFVNEHGCAIPWLPVLMIENSQQQRHTGAAVESLRNEVVAYQQSDTFVSLQQQFMKEISQ